MTQLFDEDNKVIPVTLVEAGPCFVTQIKSNEQDKYEAVQIGYEKLTKKHIKSPQKDRPYRYLKEFRDKEGKSEKVELKVGDEIKANIFTEGEKVKIASISKGKGFQGGVKRHGFSGRDATHGTKHEERTIGSIGSAFPQRVIKGKKMPGRMGTDRVTSKNLEIIKIKDNIIAIKGAIPGKRGSLVEISTVK